jgi:hypothetical protein
VARAVPFPFPVSVARRPSHLLVEDGVRRVGVALGKEVERDACDWLDDIHPARGETLLQSGHVGLVSLFIALQVFVRGEDGGSGDGVAYVGEVEEAPASVLDARGGPTDVGVEPHGLVERVVRGVIPAGVDVALCLGDALGQHTHDASDEDVEITTLRAIEERAITHGVAAGVHEARLDECAVVVHCLDRAHGATCDERHEGVGHLKGMGKGRCEKHQDQDRGAVGLLAGSEVPGGHGGGRA